MAEALSLGLDEAASKPGGGGGPVVSAASSSSSGEALFQRRIEFHPARKPFSLLSSSGGNFYVETLNPSSDSRWPGSNSGSSGATVASAPPGKPGKRSDGGELYEHGLDPELSFQITFRRIGAGLANLGNTCFLNSVLQCLTYTEPFAAYLQSGRHKSSCRTAGFCAMCALQNHVMIALQSTGKILSPSHLVRNLRCISRNFSNSRQEDAHEYMVNLLESMHKCCLPSGVPSESASAYEKSLVHKIFGGRLRSQVKCTQCSYCSNKFDPFLDLSLEIARADSLHKALSHFTAVEQLDGGEKQYQCQRCKQKVRALKQLTVHKAPYVLTIHLKRFDSHAPGQKIDKKVEFQPRLDLKPFVSDPHEGDLKYTLYGVLVHAGWSTHSGHYYCYIRTSTGMWYTLDDNRVFQVGEKTVLEQKAYMLFYFRNRRNSAPKRPLEVTREENVSANASKNKGLPFFSSALRKTDEVFFMGRTSGISDNCSDIFKANAASEAKASSTKDETPGDTLLKDSLRNNDHALLKETSILQNNGHAGREGLALNSSKDSTNSSKDSTLDPSLNVPSSKKPLLEELGVLTANNAQLAMEGLVQSGLSNNNLHHSVEEGLTQSALSKNNTGVRNLLHADSPVLPVTKQSSTAIDHLPSGCNEEIRDSNVLHPEKNGCGQFQGPKPRKLFKETSMDEKVDLVKEKSHRNATSCKMVTDLKSEQTEPFNLLDQSGAVVGHIQKEALRATETEHKDTALNGDDPNGLPLQKKDASVLKSDLSGQPSTANIFTLKEALAKTRKGRTGVDCYKADVKHRKLPKILLAKSLALGPRRLFFASLNVRKRKKHKRGKMRESYARNSRREITSDSISSDQRTSTSQTMADGDATRSPNVHIPVDLVRENGFLKEKYVKLCNGGSLNMKGMKHSEKHIHNRVGLATNGLVEANSSSAASQCEVRETHANTFHMLTRGLDNTRVAKWDEREHPSFQIHRFNDETTSSIGYVADEWDEEYDKGKRKKVKKSHQSFGGLNPFQEIAPRKAQQKGKMIEQTSYLNQPFRI